MIFPEGCESNGKCLLPFKRGAFEGLKPVQPLILKQTPNTVNQSYDCITLWPLVFLVLSNWTNRFEKSFFPAFIPNDYLFTTHADKGKEKWEVYAWAVRDLMAKEGKFEKHDD